ncbi:MAG: hypothetical protein NHB36_09240 [Nitrospira sp.]|nr:hypothetical protein [Nitrospira sp.]
MKVVQVPLFTFALAVAVSLPVSAELSTPSPEPADMWECPMEDGTSVYTNKERSGCREVLLKPLSVVPSLEHLPTALPPAAGPALDDGLVQHDRSVDRSEQVVPDWARQWYASMAPAESAKSEVCALYSEWLHLAYKTRGGFFFGSDPSYGGDLSGRAQRGASQSFYDNARWVTLLRLFGTGFVPVGCP